MLFEINTVNTNLRFYLHAYHKYHKYKDIFAYL